MKRELLAALGGVALSALLVTNHALAQGAPAAGRDAGRAAKTAVAASAAAAAPATSAGAGHAPGPVDPSTPMPAGHPMVASGDGDGDGDENPHGGGAAGQGDPHGGGMAGGGGGQGDAPEDGAMEDPTIPKGAVEVHIADPTGKPLGKTEVTLGIVYNSVAKGESRKRVSTVTDDVGTARFKDLEIGSGVAYRPMVLKDGATFSVTPFQLGPKSGMRALLHVYPVTNDLEQTLVVSQSMLYAEVKDDRIQIQQALKIYNFGRNAWVPPPDLIVALPETFTAFATQQGMTDVGADAVPKKGIKLRGTFSPGQHVIEFKWQLPYSGEAEAKFDVGMPPHLAAARIIAPASKGMGMEVDGFEPTKTSTDGMGQRALVTEKQLKRDDPPVKSIRVTIKGLPTEGSGKVIATMLALSGLVTGLVFGVRKAPARNTKRERQSLLAALEGLEMSHRDGTIGPKTYERARRELIDELARTFAADTPREKSARKKARG
ncbi:MAG: hypothetical protein JWO86_1784 [Myxococcaceae bacterium]|nr:hypothetical protein [Myxococcaceae bacterium]